MFNDALLMDNSGRELGRVMDSMEPAILEIATIFLPSPAIKLSEKASDTFGILRFLTSQERKNLQFLGYFKILEVSRTKKLIIPCVS